MIFNYKSLLIVISIHNTGNPRMREENGVLKFQQESMRNATGQISTIAISQPLELRTILLRFDKTRLAI